MQHDQRQPSISLSSSKKRSVVRLSFADVPMEHVTRERASHTPSPRLHLIHAPLHINRIIIRRTPQAVRRDRGESV